MRLAQGADTAGQELETRPTVFRAPPRLGESVMPSGRASDSASTDTNMTQFEAVVSSFQPLSAEDQLSLIWKLLSLRSTSEAEGELGAIAKVKTTTMQEAIHLDGFLWKRSTFIKSTTASVRCRTTAERRNRVQLPVENHF